MLIWTYCESSPIFANFQCLEFTVDNISEMLCNLFYKELILLSLGFVVTVLKVTGYDASSDTCSHKVVGDGGNDGIHHVHTSCQEGQIQWIDPHGGLEVQFHRPAQTRLCLLISAADATVHIYDGYVRISTVDASGKSTISELCINDQKTNELVRFESWRPGVDASITMDFLVEAMLPQSLDEICRPCSPEEVIQAYCSHDFVATGSLLAVRHEPSIDLTVISVSANAVYRQKSSIFTVEAERDSRGLLYRPLVCATKMGAGEFLFLGRVRFGKGYVTCAPQIEEWNRIRKGGYESECDLQR